MTDSAQPSSVFVSDVHQSEDHLPTPDFNEPDDTSDDEGTLDSTVHNLHSTLQNPEPTSHTPNSDDQLDPRHQRRIQLMQQLFAYSFYRDEELQKAHLLAHPEIQPIIDQLSQIDQEIQAHAPERPVAQINKVDLAILRVIVFELKTSQTPQKVVIDEGIELAKEFGTDSSPRFVNGVLAQFLK